MLNIQIGCCGWSYDDWVGPFYPPGAQPSEYLARYAERFDIVEVDSTFYRAPSPRMVEGWHARTPDHFRLSLKLPQVITHEKMLLDCDEERDGFLTTARLLGEKLHSICLQFGYFNKQKFAHLDAFLERLDPFLENWPVDVPVAVEIRNKYWLNEKFAACLRRHQAAMVLVLQSWMPSPDEVLRKLDPVTGRFAYVRVLGDREGVEKVTTTWNKVVLDRTDELRRLAESLVELAGKVPVVTFVNNHYAGYAPESSATLRQLVEQASEAVRHPRGG